ncbi:UbiD family decarboxylase [Shimwellia blattae]|uniref:Putative carboxylyase-related protein n=1 Tax=Shimwellia blattae (strain ATCC 29907 / DSM 4481 / JCM 1650 / NBRC 105725 / CDC 9005-74) TaxID=630626 RepID=I2B4Z8_SHIBC|nr:UbiD family decarboxylase [Shimwellia blattae]AFJ45602.1 putative carboxylyase-related protein [Shimwellia blattae DSM 4481 = NBRC 105725]GAB81459.1 3-octaprenyl-4-hydroxybenzoate carboxy-lyase [Shimwellia blattae DSM 4481 = NBRC 105725]VDY63084.1 Phenolic acid decarboxylase subunit C [Shimwellia blattae]VEC20270.1 Phenolic acid decarboxylase subunit C [Shimwellia blattae]
MKNKDKIPVHDLRSALELLKTLPGEYVETFTEVDPHAELSGVYRYVGAGGTCQRPTRKNGPAMVFHNIKGFRNTNVAIGLNGSRKRVGHFLNCAPEKLGFLLKDSVKHAIAPVDVSTGNAVCQEVVHLATDPDFDLRKLLPAPTNTEEDAGPYITMGLCYASDPQTHESDITIHRLCVQSKDELTMWLTPGRHIDAFRIKAEAAGKALPISISIGVDPAIEVAACFEPPTTPLGFNELSIAGALRGRAVEMVQCKTINEKAIAHAEIVIEGELLPDVRMQEDINTHTGRAMPEFPGYTGEAKAAIPVIKVKAVTHRVNPIWRTTLGPGEEHVNMAGIPTEASILDMVERAMPGKLLNVFAHSAGGGKLLAVMQFKKSSVNDEGRQRQAALLAFSAFPELKHVILVDEDVDIFDTDDVLWAMQTRYQGDIDTITIPGVRCHPLDPSQVPEYSPFITQQGMTCKTIFDCTVPFHLKTHFERSTFKEVDVKRFLPDFE